MRQNQVNKSKWIGELVFIKTRKMEGVIKSMCWWWFKLFERCVRSSAITAISIVSWEVHQGFSSFGGVTDIVLSIKMKRNRFGILCFRCSSLDFIPRFVEPEDHKPKERSNECRGMRKPISPGRKFQDREDLNAKPISGGGEKSTPHGTTGQKQGPLLKNWALPSQYQKYLTEKEKW